MTSMDLEAAELKMFKNEVVDRHKIVEGIPEGVG